MKKCRRQAFSVTSSLQYRFLAMSLIYCFVIVCFLVGAVFGPDMYTMSDQSLNLEIRGAAASRVLTNRYWAWPAFFLLVVLLGIHSFHEFQKVAGPLYRFRWVFGQLEKGNIVFPVKIRKKDYLREDVEAINKMLASIVRKLGDISQANEEALKSIDELEQTLNAGGEKHEEQTGLLHAHREHLEKLSTLVRFFRLEGEGQNKTASEHDAPEREGEVLKDRGHGQSRFATGV